MKRALVVLLAIGCSSKPKTTPTMVLPPTGGGSGSAVVTTPPPAALDDKAPIPMWPAIKKGQLANGLTYYVMANKKPEKRVQLWLAVNAGSVLETDEQRGYAHLLEHIAFEGTKRFPKHDIQDLIEKSGMQFGADLNAYTSFDETVYQLQVPTDDPKTVAKAIDVIRDWTADITIDNKEVLDERRIIEEERRTRNNVQFRMLQQLIPIAYKGSKYADRLPIGTVKEIDAANGEKLKKLYKSWYRPELMAVIVVGDIDAADIETQIKTKFADVAKDASAPKREAQTIEIGAGRFGVARDKEQSNYQISIDYQIPHRSFASIGDMKRFLTEQLFTFLVDARMAILARRGDTAAWTAGTVGFGSSLRPVDEIGLAATPIDGTKILDSVGNLAAEIARVRQHGFSKEELEQAKATMLQSYEENATEIENRESNSIVEEAVRNFLTNEAMGGANTELALAKQIVPAITNEQLVALAKYFDGEKGRVIMIQAPAKGDVPNEAAITAKLVEGYGRQMPVWDPSNLSAPIIKNDPKPGTITAKKQLPQGITEWTLSNGAVVYLKKTDFKKDEVALTASSLGGVSLVDDAHYAPAIVASSVVGIMGYGNYSPEDLEKKLAGKKASVSVTIDDMSEHVAAEASPNDMTEMMQLVHGAFTEPHRDQGAFTAWQAQMKQIAQFLRTNAEGVFTLAMIDTLFDKHKRAPRPAQAMPEAQVEKLKLDDIIAQYSARMANAADFQFTIVGAFDEAKIQPLVEMYLASLPAKPGKREVVKDLGVRLHKGVANPSTKFGDQPTSYVAIVSWAPTKWTPEGAADARALEGVINIELLDVIRERMGAAYSISGNVGVRRDPSTYQYSRLLVFSQNAPERVAEVQKEIWKKLDDLGTTGPAKETVDKVKEQIIKSHEAEQLQNEYWTAVMEQYGRYGDDIDHIVKRDWAVARITADNIKAAAKLFAGKANRLTFVQNPDKK